MVRLGKGREYHRLRLRLRVHHGFVALAYGPTSFRQPLTQRRVPREHRVEATQPAQLNVVLVEPLGDVRERLVDLDIGVIYGVHDSPAFGLIWIQQRARGEVQLPTREVGPQSKPGTFEETRSVGGGP